MMKIVLLAAIALFGTTVVAEDITCLWLTHNANEPNTLVVNWQTEAAGPSRVEYGASESLGRTAGSEGAVTLHHVELPFPQEGTLYYRVTTGEAKSTIHPVKAYAGKTLRIAAAANWFLHPPLDALLKDDPHLLLSCGDLVIGVAQEAGNDAPNTTPFSNLVDTYPELFARVPFLPVPGNHDRQTGPAEVHDIEAEAFRAFFPLPGDGRYYHFDIPAFGVRLIGLDLSHIAAMGTPRQSCLPFDKASEQFRWYRDLQRNRTQRFVVSYFNEWSHLMRGAEGGAWENVLRRGSAVLSGFGSYAERAEEKDLPYFNTGLKSGGDYRDPSGKFFRDTASYILLSFPDEGERMTVELKGLDGSTLDQSDWPDRPRPGNRR